MSNLQLNLSNTNGVQTLSSLEIVGLINEERERSAGVGSYKELRHADFLVKVSEVLNGGERNFSSSYKSLQNKDLPCYRFPKREACLMLMSYSYDLQAKVFDAWMVAEEKLKNSGAVLALPNFEDPAEAAIAWAEQFKARRAIQLVAKQQQEALKEAQPKVEFHDQVAENTGLQTMNEVAKILKVKLIPFYQFLREKKVMQKLGINNVPQTRYCAGLGNQGWFEVAEAFKIDNYGERKLYPKVRVTGKGVVGLQRLLSNEGSHLIMK